MANFSRALRVISRHYLLIVFLICFFLRLIPELRYPDLPIGYDTVEYIAYLRDYALQLNPFQTYTGRNNPPLLPILLTPFLVIVDPWYLMKIWGPLMCGLSASFSSLLARRVFRVNENTAMLAGLVGGLNIIALGSTQQWHRHMLGTVLLLAYLANTRSKRDLARIVPLLLMAMAYEPTAALSSILAVYHVLKSDRFAARSAYAALAGVSVALLVWYMRVPIVSDPITGISMMGIINSSFPSTTVDLIVWGCVFLLPLTPMILVLKQIPGSYRLILAILLLAITQPALMPYTSLLEQHRWASMLIFTSVPPAIAGYLTIDKRLLITFALVTLVVGAVYVAVPDSSDFYLSPLSGAWQYRYQKGFPWGLKPVLSMENYYAIKNISVAIQMSDNTTLTSIWIYPWIHLDVRNPTGLIALEYEPSIYHVASYLNKSETKCVYVVTSIDLEKNRESMMKQNSTDYQQLEQLGIKRIVSGSYVLYEVCLMKDLSFVAIAN